TRRSSDLGALQRERHADLVSERNGEQAAIPPYERQDLFFVQIATDRIFSGRDHDVSLIAEFVDYSGPDDPGFRPQDVPAGASELVVAEIQPDDDQHRIVPDPLKINLFSSHDNSSDRRSPAFRQGWMHDDLPFPALCYGQKWPFKYNFCWQPVNHLARLPKLAELPCRFNGNSRLYRINPYVVVLIQKEGASRTIGIPAPVSCHPPGCGHTLFISMGRGFRRRGEAGVSARSGNRINAGSTAGSCAAGTNRSDSCTGCSGSRARSGRFTTISALADSTSSSGRTACSGRSNTGTADAGRSGLAAGTVGATPARGCSAGGSSRINAEKDRKARGRVPRTFATKHTRSDHSSRRLFRQHQDRKSTAV